MRETTSYSAQNTFIKALLPLFPAIPKQTSSWTCDHVARIILESITSKQAEKLIINCKNVAANSLNLNKFDLMAIANYYNLLKAVCEKAGVISAQFFKTKNGYNPAHFRALLTNENEIKHDLFIKAFDSYCSIKMDKKNVRLLEMKNVYSQTAQQLLNLAQSKSAAKTLFNKDKNASIASQKAGVESSEIDQINPFVSFEKSCMGNFRFVSQTVVDPIHLFKQWRYLPSYEQLNADKLSVDLVSKASFKQFLEKQPKLIVRPSIVKEGEIEKQRGCGVFAQEKIALGSIVALYAGELVILDEKEQSLFKSDYYYKIDFAIDSASNTTDQRVDLEIGIDSQEFRSVGSMVNDGLPNVCAVDILADNQGLRMMVFVATRNIKQGEEILWSYGSASNVKYEQDYAVDPVAIELLEKELQDKQKKSLFLEVFEAEKEVRNKKELLNMKDLIGRVLYAISTPKVLFHLVHKNLLSVKEIIHLMSSNFMKQSVAKRTTFMPYTLGMGCLLAQMRIILQFMDQKNGGNINKSSDQVFKSIMTHFGRVVNENKKHPNNSALEIVHQVHIFVNSCRQLMTTLNTSTITEKALMQFDNNLAAIPSVSQTKSKEVLKLLEDPQLYANYVSNQMTDLINQLNKVIGL